MTKKELEKLGEYEVRHRLDRGDYSRYVETIRIKSWLRSRKRERDFESNCKKAEMSAAFRAWRSARNANIIATIAVIIAAVAAKEEMTSLIQNILTIIGP